MKAYLFSIKEGARSVALSEKVRSRTAAYLSEKDADPAFSITYGDRGRPLLSSRPAAHMSLSHSGTLALLGLSSRPLGVDIERLRPVDHLAVARRFFCPEESEYIFEHGPGAFFTLWTLKESLLKRSGEGLSGGLSTHCLVRDGEILPSLGGVSLRTLREGDLFFGFAYSDGGEPVLIRG